LTGWGGSRTALTRTRRLKLAARTHAINYFYGRRLQPAVYMLEVPLINATAQKPGRSPNSGPNPPKPWAERLQDVRAAYTNIPGAFRLVWSADKRSTVMMAILTIVSAALPASQAWAGKLIVDSVVHSISTNSGSQAGLTATLPFLLLEFGLLLIGTILGQLRQLVEHVLNARLGNYISTAVIRKALTLDLQYFEDASFYDKLQNARREADFRTLGIINGSFMAVQSALTLASFAVILLAFSPLIALILFGATIPSFIAQGRYSSLQFRILTRRAPESRRMDYLERLLTVDDTVKEIKLFGLVSHYCAVIPIYSGSSLKKMSTWPGAAH